MHENFYENLLTFFKKPIALIDSSFNLVFLNDDIIESKLIKIIDNLAENFDNSFRYKYVIDLCFKYNFVQKIKFECDDSFYVFNLVPICNSDDKYLLICLSDDFEEISTIAEIDYRDKILSIEKLTSIMVHDINNVIGGLSGTVSLMEFKLLKGFDISSEELNKYIQTMSASINRVIETLDGYRKLYINKKTINKEININLFIDLLKSAFEENKYLEFIQEASENITLKIDIDEIKNAISYIIDNSLDAIRMKEELDSDFKGHILLKTKVDRLFSEKDFILIEVIDNGIGIDKKIIDRVFEPYFSAKKNSGKGLGLTLADYAIIKSGGFININSQEGEWTKVRLYLPIY